jgi:hypothetical protein
VFHAYQTQRGTESVSGVRPSGWAAVCGEGWSSINVVCSLAVVPAVEG